LQGYEDVYRVRSGVARIIYSILDKRLLIIVLKIGHRKDIYR
jgi:mRNA interferase RelE/StbE